MYMEYGKACEILGVNENANKNEIERKYTILLKKHRITKADSQAAAGEEIADMDQVTAAYNLLMGYEEPKAEEVPSKAAPILKKAGIDEKKAKNFWYYYKFHILGGIVLLLVLVFSLKSCLTAERPDFNIAFIGDIYFMENDLFKENVKKAVPEIKVPGIDGAMLNKDDEGQQQYAMQTKAMILFGAADVDLYIIDKDTFTRYGKDGAYMCMDDYAGKLGIDANQKTDFKIKPDDAAKEGIYAVDVSKSKFLKNSNIVGKSLVAAIPIKSKRVDDAVKLIKLLMEE